MKKLLLTLLVCCAAAAGAEEAARKIEVHGHRGTRGTRPENTLAAFKEALRVGVDVLELDMNVTADGTLVVSHDRFVNTEICLGPKGEKPAANLAISSLNLAELKGYDCGTLRNPKFPKQVPVPGEKMPTLAEVFELVRRSTEPAAAKVGFNIETKIVPGEPEVSPSPEIFAMLVVEALKEHGMTGRTVVQSFDWRTLAEIRKLDPKIKLAQLTEANLLDPAALAASKAEVISPWFKWTTAEMVAALHKAGKKAAPWTLNDKKDWDKAVEYGVDAVITDYPEEFIAYLKGKKLR